MIRSTRRRSPWFLLSLLASLFVSGGAPVFAQGSAGLVISQVYGGGGGSSTSASYKTDFIEIFNAGQTSVDLSAYSVQYGPAGSTATPSTIYSGITVLNAVQLAPGQYYLVSEGSAGTGGATLTGADQTGTINLAQASGKVALVKGTTLLNSGNACADATIVSQLGYGSITPASCAAGSAPTAVTSVSTAAIRTSSCVNSGNNAADFTIATPNPRNTATTPAPCTAAAALGVAAASANPASVTAGNATTLSVTVSPGSASTGIAVTADLSSVGGSATQALAGTSTANVFTYSLNVGGSIAAGSYTLPVRVTDQQGGSATGSIALTVQPAAVVTPIATLQGDRNTYLAATSVSTTGIVTVIQTAGFYIQTPSSTPGSTGVAEGLYVYTGSGKVPTTVVQGAIVSVTGKLSLYPAANASHTPSLELTSPAITVTSTGNSLPTPVSLPSGLPTAGGGIYQLTRYEGMLVKFPSLTAVGPTDGFNTEATETVTSTGQFYAVATGTARPYREPGMDFRDFPATTCPSLTNCTATVTSGGAARPANLVLYDDNPERLIVESSLGGGTALDVSPGAVLTNATGVIDFSYATDVPYGDPARLILLPGSVTAGSYTPSTLAVSALPAPSANQFTVAAFNVERFFDSNAANDLYYNPATGKTGKSSAVDVTADAYSRRLKKFSLAIRTVLNNPDIISVEEVENLQVLKDMAAQIDADTTTGTKPGYVAYGTDSTTTFTNDVGGISVGFLIKPSTTNVVSWEQKGTQDLVPSGTALNDRPSQVLHATINRGTGARPYPITVISNHLRSLNNVGTDANVRTKKELQAEGLANLIQQYQSAGEHVIAVGDMNAFQFSDGYTDTLGTLTGRLSADGTAVQPGKAIVSPAATNLITTLPAAAQQSYTEWGSAQVLDHAIVTADIAGSSTLAVAHIDADFPVVLFNDATTPAALSDHDPLLAYLSLPAPVVSGTLTGTGTFGSTTVGSTSTGQVFTLTNTGEAAIAISGIAVTGDFAQSNNCGSTLSVGTSCAINVVFRPTASGTRTGSLTVSSNASLASVSLSGTAPVPDFTMADAQGSTSTAVSTTAGQTATVPLTLTSVNGFSGSVAFTCTAGGFAPTGVTCSVASVTLAAAGTATANVTFATTSRTSASGVGPLPGSKGWLAFGLLVAALCGSAVCVFRTGRVARVGGLLVLLFALAAGISGCGDKGNSGGTAAGSYGYTVTASGNGVIRTQSITLTVK